MFRSKIIDIMRTFTPSEVKEFREFIRSPYHNRNGNVIKLYELLRRGFPDFTAGFLTKEKLFSKLYPGKKFNDTVIRILLSDLSKLAEEYLSFMNISGNEYVMKRHLLKELQIRRIDNLFNIVLKETEKIVENKELGKEYGFYYRHDLESIKNNFYLARNKQELTGEIIARKGESIICYALIDLFIISESILSSKNAYNIEPKVNLTDELLGRTDLEGLLDYIKEYLPGSYPTVALFYYLYRTIKDIKDEFYLSAARELFRNNINEFNLNEKILIYAKIENCCKEKSRSGNDKFVKELFEIYKERISLDLIVLPRRKYLNIWDYRDILVTALELKEIGWAENFVNKFSGLLDPIHMENALTYGRAIVNFGNGRYEEAIRDISTVKYDYFLFKIDMKNLLLKIYYELGYFSEAMDTVDSYRHFLAKNRSVSGSFKKYNMDFVKFYVELIRVKENKGQNLDELVLGFGRSDQIRNKGWIAGKIDELRSEYD